MTVTTLADNPATIVHNKYPHTGNVHTLTPSGFGKWYEHQLPDGRLVVAVWLYEGTDATRRTIIVREWNNPDSPVFVASNIHHGAAASWKTLEFMDILAGL